MLCCGKMLLPGERVLGDWGPKHGRVCMAAILFRHHVSVMFTPCSYSGLGVVSGNLGRWEDAATYYAQAAQLDPGNPR